MITTDARPLSSTRSQRGNSAYKRSNSIQNKEAQYSLVERSNLPSKYSEENEKMVEKKSESLAGSELAFPPPPKPAWSQFADHVKVVSRSDLFLGETKESYKSMCSEDHQKTLSVIKQMSLKKQIKAMRLRVKAMDKIRDGDYIYDSATSAEDTECEESEDEETVIERENRRTRARKHWEIIRRYVYDKTKKRRKKVGGFHKDRAFNKIKAQAKAKLNPAQTRREIFERYGIVPRPGRLQPEDVMKPNFSDKTFEIIAKFEQIQVLSLNSKTRPHTSGAYLPKYSKSQRKNSVRPRTSVFGGSFRERFT
ncbi:hypothetical protein EB796_006390 [Bugula neritina]|uniref:Uncharacterized protein n=1 Tax=Bugula neritina TaxID=10212 RepID=A0A7J7K9I3_BUGNE|nr:hypothetical protein EB796_006390 [Bugula neritina]